jgi:hypothetical protein
MLPDTMGLTNEQSINISYDIRYKDKIRPEQNKTEKPI